jgi:hypothetical protein
MARTFQNPIDVARERLAELARLEHDWDSYGAYPPTARAISMAQAMIERTVERLGERGVPHEIMPIADGGISLEWRYPAIELGLNACPEGGWSYLLVERDGPGRRSVEGYDLSDEDAGALILRVVTIRDPDGA